MFFYVNGTTGSTRPAISIQKQSVENLIRLFLEVNLLNHVDSKRAKLESNSVSCISNHKCRLGCHRVLRRHHEYWIVNFAPSQLENEALGFVKDGWIAFEIKIKLFHEKEFDEEIKRVSGPPDRVSHQWTEPDPHELMHVEGLSLNDVFLLRCLLSAEGSRKYKVIHYTFVLNKYKYFATYEVCSARSSPYVMICFSSSSAKFLEDCC